MPYLKSIRHCISQINFPHQIGDTLSFFYDISEKIEDDFTKIKSEQAEYAWNSVASDMMPIAHLIITRLIRVLAECVDTLFSARFNSEDVSFDILDRASNALRVVDSISRNIGPEIFSSATLSCSLSMCQVLFLEQGTNWLQECTDRLRDATNSCSSKTILNRIGTLYNNIGTLLLKSGDTNSSVFLAIAYQSSIAEKQSVDIISSRCRAYCKSLFNNGDTEVFSSDSGSCIANTRSLKTSGCTNLDLTTPTNLNVLILSLLLDRVEVPPLQVASVDVVGEL